jgi:hypothetical protein
MWMKKKKNFKSETKDEFWLGHSVTCIILRK